MDKDPLTCGNAAQGVFAFQARMVLVQHSGNSRNRGVLPTAGPALGVAGQIHGIGHLVESAMTAVRFTWTPPQAWVEQWNPDRLWEKEVVTPAFAGDNEPMTADVGNNCGPPFTP